MAEVRITPRYAAAYTRDMRAIELRSRGYTWAEIAQELGLSDGKRAHEYVRNRLRVHQDRRVEDHREALCWAIERTIDRWWPILMESNDVSEMEIATNALTKCWDRLASYRNLLPKIEPQPQQAITVQALVLQAAQALRLAPGDSVPVPGAMIEVEPSESAPEGSTGMLELEELADGA
jgi:hypothetical protein